MDHLELDSANLAQAIKLMEVFKERYKTKEKAVKTEDIIFHLRAIGMAVNDRHLRKLIGYIRNNDLLKPGFIVSDVADGYWLTVDKKEQNDFLDRQLNRMSNQFDNVKMLHQRIRHGEPAKEKSQTSLF